MTEYDQKHVGDILKGEGKWFTARLFRLIACSDSDNKRKLAHVFPKEVGVIHQYQPVEALPEIPNIIPITPTKNKTT